MSDAIVIEGLSKKYRIRKRVQGDAISSRMLQTELFKAATGIFRRGKAEDEYTDFWALRDIDLAVPEGQILGLIGHNGAGKSTLLKVLSRIIAPTTGTARIRGRVGSMLEVGTGFHPELTGRENIFLNGAILGMRRARIQERFDEIVEFAGVEMFLETPVKRYSSGMYVRLAFAVAAHLEPEVLLVDEVLAVGDKAFRQKCLGRMDTVARGGRTIVFVSHNMAAIEGICQRVVLLDRGQIVTTGAPREVIKRYVEAGGDQSVDLRDRKDRMGTGELKVVKFEIRNADGKAVDTIVAGQPVEFALSYEMTARPKGGPLQVVVTCRTQFDAPVFVHNNELSGDIFGEIPEHGTFVCRIPRLPLPAAGYHLGCVLKTTGGDIDRLSDAVSLYVAAGDFYETGLLPPASHATCLIEGSWRLEG